jgi:hypothetical protein
MLDALLLLQQAVPEKHRRLLELEYHCYPAVVVAEVAGQPHHTMTTPQHTITAGAEETAAKEIPAAADLAGTAMVVNCGKY